MKKSRLTAAACGALLWLPQSASAETAQINIELIAGSLSIETVPQPQFPSISVRDLALSSAILSAPAKGLITLGDYRGSGAGWQLLFEYSPFTNGQSSLAGSRLSFTAAAASQTIGADSAAMEDTTPAFIGPDALLPDTKTPVWTTTIDQPGRGRSQAEVQGFTLSLQQSNRPLAGSYQSTFTWTLQAAPH